MSRVTCPNCGRPLHASDPVPSHAFETTAVVSLRALFTGRLAQMPCPAACGGMLDYEPSLLVMSLDPYIVWVSGGDALGEERLAAVRAELAAPSSQDEEVPDVRLVARQHELVGNLYEHLRATARALTPLNRARAANAAAEYMLREWRTLTPAVLVASDIVTLVERVGGAAPQGHAAAQTYFEEHATALGHLQLQCWVAMCRSHSRPSGTQRRLQEDLTRYVNGDVVFGNAAAGLAEHISRLLQRERRRPLLEYVSLATLACVHHVGGGDNPLAAEWTALWWRFELMLLDAAADADADASVKFERLRLAPEILAATLVRRTLAEEAAGCLLPLFSHGADATQMIRRLHAIGERAGYPALVSDVMATAQLKGADFLTAGAVMAQVRRSIEQGWTTTHAAGTVMMLDAALDLYAGTLADSGDVAALTTVFEQARALADDDVSRARVEAWFGARLVTLHREHLLLDHIGADARSWEDALDDGLKSRLWTERANALRAAERRADNLAWRERIAALTAVDPASANHRVALRNLAIAHREHGAPDRALALLLPLLDDRHASDRPRVLESVATTYTVLGERARAVAALDEAITLSDGPDTYLRTRLVAARAALGAHERPAEIERRLLESPQEAWTDPLALLQECAAWANLSLGGHPMSDAGTARFGAATNMLAGRLGAESDVPPRVREQGYLLLAEIVEMFGIGDSYRVWGAAADEADRTGQVPHPLAVLALARHAYSEHRVDDARQILMALPDAMARDLQRLERVDVALGALTSLKRRFDTLTALLMDEGLAHDARVLAELRRDPVRQSGTKRTDEEVRAIVSGAIIGRVLTGDAAVLEFVESSEGALAALLTWKKAADGPTVAWLEWPESLDPIVLRDRLLHRLQGWLLDRPGDPFAVAGWGEFRAWIRGALDGILPPSGHLVVLEHEMLAGLPFHVAVAPERTCSYASSWSSLARVGDALRPAPRSIGVGMVPAFSDDPRVAEAMRAAEQRSAAAAARHGLAWASAVGAACDRDALARLMATSDVLFIACHGFLDEARHEVAWVLAHKGGLPGRSGSVASGAGERVTHFGWRDVETLPRTPDLVLSAACSSGRALLTGLGERLGLFPSLARRGTRTLIAPAWDVEADIVLPIAARALELSLDGARPRAAAVRMACEEASRELPSWIAWSLTVEGAWR